MVKTATMERERWVWFAVAGALSILTMPLTAVWFVFVGFAVMAVCAAWAATRRDEQQRSDILGKGAALGTGLLLGPAVYLALAVLR